MATSARMPSASSAPDGSSRGILPAADVQRHAGHVELAVRRWHEVKLAEPARRRVPQRGGTGTWSCACARATVEWRLRMSNVPPVWAVPRTQHCEQIRHRHARLTAVFALDSTHCQACVGEEVVDPDARSGAEGGLGTVYGCETRTSAPYEVNRFIVV